MTGSAQESLDRAATTTPETCDLLWIAGGDGSLGTIADHLPDPELPLALLPCGTANSLSRELRLPRRPAAQAALLADPHWLTLHVGEVQPEGSAPRRFLCFAGVGLDGAMVHELERSRRGTLGRLRWFPPVLRVARHLPDPHLTATFDDGTVRTELGEVLASRIRDFGSVFRLPAGVDPGSDQLAVLLFPRQRHVGWMGTALRGWLQGLRAGRDCEMRLCRSVRVSDGLTGTPAPVQADGDACGHGPVTIRLTDQRLRLLVPPGSAGASARGS
jgi:diacylglycerol kinase family enzyme